MSWDGMRNMRSVICASLVYSLISCSAPKMESNVPKPEIVVELSPVEQVVPEISLFEVLDSGVHFLKREEWYKARDVLSYLDSRSLTLEDRYFIKWGLDWCDYKIVGGSSYDIGSRTLSVIQNSRPPSKNDADTSYLERATILLESLIESFPMNYTYHADLGKCYAMSGDFSSASKEFVKSVDLWPTDGHGLYTRIVQSYIGSRNIHNILDVGSMIKCSSPDFVMPRLLDAVDDVFWSGVSISHDSSDTSVAQGFANLFDALGTRMLDRGKTAKAMQYFCMSASNRFVIGEPPEVIKNYLHERYDKINVLLHGEMRPLADVYKNSMDERIQIPREKELWKLLKE